MLVGCKADNAQQRLKGSEDVVVPAHIEIVDKRADNTDRAKARSNVEDILNAHHDLALLAGRAIGTGGPRQGERERLQTAAGPAEALSGPTL